MSETCTDDFSSETDSGISQCTSRRFGRNKTTTSSRSMCTTLPVRFANVSIPLSVAVNYKHELLTVFQSSNILIVTFSTGEKTAKHIPNFGGIEVLIRKFNWFKCLITSKSKHFENCTTSSHFSYRIRILLKSVYL